MKTLPIDHPMKSGKLVLIDGSSGGNGGFDAWRLDTDETGATIVQDDEYAEGLYHVLDGFGNERGVYKTLKGATYKLRTLPVFENEDE